MTTTSGAPCVRSALTKKYITGDADGYDKFKAWAKTMPYLIGNPLYHWTHLELQRYFGIYKTLSPETCDEIWGKCNAKIKKGGFSPRELIEKSGVVCVCTTDDPADTLEYHKLLAKDKSFSCRVLPAFRPEKGSRYRIAVVSGVALPYGKNGGRENRFL